jgi:hypothetical protein
MRFHVRYSQAENEVEEVGHEARAIAKGKD